MPRGFRTASGKAPGAALREFARQVDAARAKVIAAVALTLVSAIKLKLSTPGRGKLRRKGKLIKGKVGRSGRMAYRSDISKLTRASAPGDPPAVDTGALRNSINYEVQWGGKHVVGTNSEYAAPLEFGATTKRGRILPRPFMRPALADVKKEMGEVAVSALKSKHKKPANPES